MVDLHSLHISEKRFVYLVQNAESFFFFFFFKFQKDISNERNALSDNNNTACMSKTGHKDQSVSISF